MPDACARRSVDPVEDSLESDPFVRCDGIDIADIRADPDMDDLDRPDPSPTETEAYVVSGWSSLDRGDLEGARAALRDLYSADPTHPALPLLAAGIRRIRPKPVPWRSALLLVVVVVVGILGIRSWTRTDRAKPRPPSTTAEGASLPQSTAPAPAEVSALGTTGNARASDLLTVQQNRPSAMLDDEVLVRQAIRRFEEAYRNHWGELAFEHCDVRCDVDQATATCVPRQVPNAPDVESDRVWTFSLRKAEDGWRIASVQPPPNSAR